MKYILKQNIFVIKDDTSRQLFDFVPYQTDKKIT
jgi:hypothetical protein